MTIKELVHSERTVPIKDFPLQNLHGYDKLLCIGLSWLMPMPNL